jgi:hypothetical protein
VNNRDTLLGCGRPNRSPAVKSASPAALPWVDLWLGAGREPPGRCLARKPRESLLMRPPKASVFGQDRQRRPSLNARFSKGSRLGIICLAVASRNCANHSDATVST